MSDDLLVGQLVSMLMRTAAEHAGAQRTVLFLSRADTVKAAAEVVTEGGSLTVRLVEEVSDQVGAPFSVIWHVFRTGQPLIVPDAATDSRFEPDPFVSGSKIRSMMCLPINLRDSTQAVFYAENCLAPNVFRESQVEALTLLASQCTLSLENARLYAELQLRERRMRRIFDLNVVGIVVWNLNGVLHDANDAFLELVGHERSELEKGLLHWLDMTPPEWQLQIPRDVQELTETGALRPVEREFFHKDGSRVSVLMSAAFFDGTEQQGVAIIVDISKQKEAEARTIDAVRRNRMLQTELVHANRVATMGHMAAWIAHDLKQPLAASVTSSNAALRWLSSDPPNIEAAVLSVDRAVRESMRAANVLDRTRALVKNVSPAPEAVDIDSVISDTLTVIASEANRNAIVVSQQLGAGHLQALADRVQIQQVILNLVVNAFEALSTASSAGAREVRVWSEDIGGQEVSVSVQDNGPGMPTPRSEDCFEAFFTTKKDGLGMGLSICRTIVESFGGRISATSDVHSGTVVRFVLPAFQREAC